MNELILFAGTFDPFHRGHRAILESALAAFPEGRALVAPARDPRWRGEPSLPYDRRLEIVRRSIEGLRAELIEEPEAVDQAALDLVRAVADRAKGGPVFYLVGADAAATFPDWRGREALLELVTLLIAPREGIEFSLDRLLEREPLLVGRVRLLPRSGVAASSTQVRAGERGLLVAGVEEISSDQV